MKKPQDDLEKDLLTQARHIAIVGLSPNPTKTSHIIGEYLLEKGYHIYPINPNHKDILGLQAYASLSEIPKDISIDIVNIFRPSEEVYDIVEDAVAIGASAIWMQLGIAHDESKALAESHGLSVIMDTCIMASHQKHMD